MGMSDDKNDHPVDRRRPTTWTVIAVVVQVARFVVDLVRLGRVSQRFGLVAGTLGVCLERSC